MSKRILLVGFLTALMALGICGHARASFLTLAERLPPATNVIIAVNVARLVDSPYGKEAEWGARLAEAWEKQPLMIPPGAQRLIMAADVKPSTFDSYWEMSLIEMDKVPSIESIAKDEGGHIDRVWDKDAVCSPINAYFVPLENNVLASITPAERSQIARWVRMPIKPEGNVTSTYIKTIVAGLSAKTDIVMAMDLEGAYGVPNIRKWLDTNDVEGVTPQNINQVVRVLGTMNGIKLEITVDNKINGKATVDFDLDASALKDCAKPIMVGLLNYVGMRLDDIPNWTFAASGKQVTMQGTLSDASLRRLLSIVQSPIPAVATAGESKGGAEQPPTDPAQASKKYYKMVCAVLDNAKGGTSAAETATWLRSAAKRIDQLPILNVDPALVEWGGMVSTKLKQVGGQAVMGQTQMNARVAGVADPQYSGYSYDNNGYYTEGSNKVDIENAKKQRRQAALEAKAQMQEQAVQVLSEIAETRPKIRADMVAKYNIEF